MLKTAKTCLLIYAFGLFLDKLNLPPISGERPATIVLCSLAVVMAIVIPIATSENK